MMTEKTKPEQKEGQKNGTAGDAQQKQNCSAEI
jgi:hypothetical protein